MSDFQKKCTVRHWSLHYPKILIFKQEKFHQRELFKVESYAFFRPKTKMFETGVEVEKQLLDKDSYYLEGGAWPLRLLTHFPSKMTLLHPIVIPVSI